jgi:hypothetical protein
MDDGEAWEFDVIVVLGHDRDAEGDGSCRDPGPSSDWNISVGRPSTISAPTGLTE